MTRTFLAGALVALLLVAAPATGWSQQELGGSDADFQAYLGGSPPTFETLDELGEAFKNALKDNKDEALPVLLGLSPTEVLKSDDVKSSIKEIREAAAKSVALKEIDPNRQIFILGTDVWPFPFPAVKADGKWSFDTVAGLEEVINRRIGENELTTIANLRAYVDAQEQYKETDWDEDGVSEYAQKLISSPGTYDGLYWQAGGGVPESPIGALIDQGEAASAAEDGYFGYRYRVLTSQGPNVAGGAYDYVINGNMIAGFGLVATPAKYDRSGIKTFIINQYGTVYEKDLGPESVAEAAKITTFDPDDGWTVVNEPGE